MRRRKIIAHIMIITGVGIYAVIFSWAGSLGWAAAAATMYALLAWDLSGLIWPASQDRSEIIRPGWKL